MSIKTIAIFIFISVSFSIGHWQLSKDSIFLKNQVNTGAKQTQSLQKAPPVVTVHIAGEVQYPGLYQLPLGISTYEALQVAGGSTHFANLDSVNLSSKIMSNKKITLRKRKQSKSLKKGSITPKVNSRLNINTATPKSLITLSGVGPSIAKRIIKARQIKPFTSYKDLEAIKGLSKKKIQSFKSQIRFK